MRYLTGLIAVLLLAGSYVSAAQEAAKCKVVGLHLCCDSCESAVNDVLEKAKVGKIDIDGPKKTVTFEAEPASCEKALKALYGAGFAGKGTINGKDFVIKTEAPDLKGDKITVKNVHVCCGGCQKAVKALFKDATVTVEGKGSQRDVVIAGKDLSAAQVLRTLTDAGFNGTIENKK